MKESLENCDFISPCRPDAKLYTPVHLIIILRFLKASSLVKYSANSGFYQHIFAFYLRDSVLLAVFYLLTSCVLQN